MAGFHAFRSFQKNQKVWLAVLGVGTMISFIILPVLMQLFTGSGGTGPSDIAQCRRFGKINEQALFVWGQNREHLGRFYIVLYQSLADPNDQERQLALRALEMTASQYQQSLEPEDLVNNWLLTQYAKLQGITIDKIDIITHLAQLTGGYLTDSIYRKVLNDVGMSEKQLEYHLSNALLNTRVYEKFGISLRTIPQSTRWEWFQRLNRQITAEVVAVPVDQFVGKVTEPTTAQLQMLFNENKDKPFDPTLVDYGFIQPTKLAFQYVKATPNKKVLDSITDEEIKKFYEENKETMFRKPVQPVSSSPVLPNLPGQSPGNLFQPGGLGGFTPSGTPGARPFPTPPKRQAIKLTEDDMEANPEAKPEEKPTVEAKPEAKPEEKPEEKPTVEAKPEAKPEEKPTVETKPEEKPEEKPATEAKPEEKPEEKPTTEAKPEAKPEEKPAAETKPEEKKETSSIGLVRTRFVSYRTDEEPAKATELAKSESKPEEPKAEPKTEQSKPETPVDLSILYKPLDEVKEQIRQTLATEKVIKSVPQIEEKMREYFQTYNIHIDKEEAVPPMPDLSDFVKGLDLELKTVPLGTIYDTVKSEFARGAMERDYLIQMFNESPIIFEPKNVEGGSYVLWVTEIQSENKPEKLDNVKETVLKRWKEIEARPLALKRAEELAAEAKNSEKSLAETFNGRNDVPVVETEPFTYKSYGQSMYAAFFAMRGIPPRIGEVCEKGVAVGDSEIDNKQIFAPGVDFMETASSLAVGEIGVVFNQPQTVAYVVRVTGSNPSEESLWEKFQNSNIMEYRLAGQPEMISDARTAWLNKIYEEIGFKWIRKPESIRRR